MDVSQYEVQFLVLDVLLEVEPKPVLPFPRQVQHTYEESFGSSKLPGQPRTLQKTR